jgi:hypothetical protein
MEATKDHISLETAKLLKDCGIESQYHFVRDREDAVDKFFCNSSWKEGYQGIRQYDFYPAYTWGEILWEYPEKFFDEFFAKQMWRAIYLSSDYDDAGLTAEILALLQRKKYHRADQFFRNNCVLINNK